MTPNPNRPPTAGRLVVLALAASVLVGVLRTRTAAPPSDPCTEGGEGCAVRTTMPEAGAPAAVRAGDFCVDVGYLCAGLADRDSIHLQRWKDFDGTIVVHVPLPDFEDAGAARDLQRAAAQGLRAWDGQPFAILADLRGDRDPHFTVQWRRSLAGTQLGVARTQWSAATGLQVVTVELATRNPYDPDRPADPRGVRLTAAHEMGHALGLPHSGSPHDVMYPTNTATSMSAQDYRTVEVLYRTRDGTVVTR